jgi:hypothetical protein
MEHVENHFNIFINVFILNISVDEEAGAVSRYDSWITKMMRLRIHNTGRNTATRFIESEPQGDVSVLWGQRRIANLKKCTNFKSYRGSKTFSLL